MVQNPNTIASPSRQASRASTSETDGLCQHSSSPSILTGHPGGSKKGPVPTATKVPEDASLYWQGCSTVIFLKSHPQHQSMPIWYTNALYNTHTRQTWWQFFVRSQGLEKAKASRQAFLDGCEDVRGNHWCGNCFTREQFIDVGEALGYPNAHDLYAVPETH